MHRHSIHFVLLNGCSWENVDISGTENVATQGTWTATFGFTPSILQFEVPGPDVGFPMFCNTGSCSIDSFPYTINVGNVNYVWAIRFIFELQTDVLEIVLKLLRHKMFRPRGTWTPTVLQIRTECSTIWGTEAKEARRSIFPAQSLPSSL